MCSPPSNDLPLEQKHQLDHQNYDHHQLQHKRAALLELVHHELVQIPSGIQLVIHQPAVIGNADFVGRQPVDARRISLRNLIELSTHSVSLRTSSRIVFSRPASRASCGFRGKVNAIPGEREKRSGAKVNRVPG